MSTMQKRMTHDVVVSGIKADLLQQKMQIQAKLDMLEKLAGKTEEQQRNLLFSLWDRDGDGKLDVSELTLGIKRLLTSLEPTLDDVDPSELLEVAMEGATQAMIALGTESSESGVKQLEKPAFQTLLNTLCEKLDLPFVVISELLVLSYVGVSDMDAVDDVVEFIALKLVEDEQDARIAVESKFRAILEDQVMLELFKKFDTDQDMEINFKELAMGLDKFRREGISFADSLEGALDALLIFDEDSTRTLNYVQFARFVLTFCAACGAPFEEVGPKLLEMHREAPADPEDLRKLKSALLTDVMSEMKHADNVVNTLQDVRCALLFQMFDRDGSGGVSFQELALGLRTFNPSSSLSDSAAVAATMMLAFDEDENNVLDPVEFADFLSTFCETIGASFDEMADYLVVSCALQNSSTERDVALLESIQPSVLDDIKKIRNEEQ